MLCDEESDSFDDDGMEQGESPQKRKPRRNELKPLKKIKYEKITSNIKKPKDELYRPPTVEELNELKETQNLYNNNLFRLQIEELIKEVRIKDKHRNTFTTWLQSFQTLISNLPEYSFSVSDIKKTTKKKLSDRDKLINSLAEKIIKCDQDLLVKFIKPEKLETFGLEKISASTGPKICYNVNLTMARACLNVKDYLNNRYFVKKYYYLAYIAHHLDGDVRVDCHNGNSFLPVVCIQLGAKVMVKLFATPPGDYFKFSRFRGNVNNVKVDVFDRGSLSDVATPYYNASLAHDVTLSANNVFLEQNLMDLSNVQEAIKLIRVWLIQRQLNVGLGSFTDEMIVYFVVYLLVKKKINKHMSSYQVIRNFWNFLSETDLTIEPIGLCEDLSILEAVQGTFDVIFLDRTGCYNVGAFLDVSVYKKVKNECGLAFKLLDDGGINAFHSLFITKLPVGLQYDLILNLADESNFDSIVSSMNDNERTKFVGYSELFVIKKIVEVLFRGLNQRASLIVPIGGDSKHKLSFGINLDPSEAFKILEMGPALNDPKEKDFKEFWGSLATDRRFKDGSVCVAVYFETQTVKDRRKIIRTIIDWVVTQKLQVAYDLHFDAFEDLLVNKKVNAGYPMGTNEECCLKAIAAFDDLAKKLRALEMPLAVTGVQGISDTLSVTDVFPPISTNYMCGNKITKTLENNIVFNDKRVKVCPRYVKGIQCVLQLEHSSKWPKGLKGIRQMKTAFFVEISKLLAKKHKIVSSVKPDVLDVLFEGYVFRCHLFLSREIGFLKKESINNGVTVYKTSPESRALEMKLDILPKLMSAIKGLQSQHPSFGPATALVKRWMRSQLIDDHHFPDNVINLLVASLYLNYSAFNLPVTPQIGFLRFLKYFSELQWRIQPVIANFNDELTKETLAEIDSKMLQNRQGCPSLFVAMPYDGCESLFSKTAPSENVSRRVQQLAKETLGHVGTIATGDCRLTVRDLFVSNLEGYDVVIHLRPLMNPQRHEQVMEEVEGEINLKAFDPAESSKVPITDFNPVKYYLRDLRDSYGDFALFFHDTYGGNYIGVLWNPKALEQKEFKVAYVNGRKLVDGKLVLNVDGLVDDFYILGKGLVKFIDKR